MSPNMPVGGTLPPGPPTTNKMLTSTNRTGASNPRSATSIRRKADRRSIPGQTSLPIVPADAYGPYPGLRFGTLMVRPGDCPGCDHAHRHMFRGELPRLLSRRGNCGTPYDLAPRTVQVSARRGRAA